VSWEFEIEFEICYSTWRFTSLFTSIVRIFLPSLYIILSTWRHLEVSVVTSPHEQDFCLDPTSASLFLFWENILRFFLAALFNVSSPA